MTVHHPTVRYNSWREAYRLYKNNADEIEAQGAFLSFFKKTVIVLGSYLPINIANDVIIGLGQLDDIALPANVACAIGMAIMLGFKVFRISRYRMTWE